MSWPQAFALVGVVTAISGMVVGIFYFATRYYDESEDKDQ